MKESSRPANWLIILLLGALSIVTPFAVDMYLPAFSGIASHFHTTTSAISLSLSTYFLGFAIGQILYGPLLDRFGRKRPLYAGLAVFILSSLACAHPLTLAALIGLRFLQAVGGCVAQVGSVAMVRDFFPPAESAKIFSLLFLMIGVSPLFAPTIGSLIVSAAGWQWIFLVLASLAAIVLTLTFLFLPEGHAPDQTISLRPQDILRDFTAILKQPQFCTYAFAGAFSFAGLFAYVAGSPIIFMDRYHVSARVFGAIFAALTMGFIGGNQANVALLRTFNSRQIFTGALTVQSIVGLLFFLAARLAWLGMPGTLLLFFLFLSCIGLTYPNAAALALAPFSRNVGTASSLLGFIQMGTGAVISTGIGLLGATAVIASLAASTSVAAGIYLLGRSFISDPLAAPEGEPAITTH